MSDFVRTLGRSENVAEVQARLHARAVEDRHGTLAGAAAAGGLGTWATVWFGLIGSILLDKPAILNFAYGNGDLLPAFFKLPVCPMVGGAALGAAVGALLTKVDAPQLCTEPTPLTEAAQRCQADLSPKPLTDQRPSE